MIERKMQDDDVMILSEDGKQLLEMKEVLDGNRVQISLNGSLPSSLVHDLQDELIALSTVGKDLFVDLSGVTYISNACRQALLYVQQQMDSMGTGSLTLQKLPDEIYREFEKIGLTELLMIED